LTNAFMSLKQVYALGALRLPKSTINRIDKPRCGKAPPNAPVAIAKSPGLRPVGSRRKTA
jgi:hypothetical protein